MHDSLIFDLDGTLWSACRASAEGWTQALRDLGYDLSISAEDIAHVSGRPYEECIRSLCPMIRAQDFSRALSVLNDREQRAVSANGGVLFPGVADGLTRLGESLKLFIVSNCQEWYLELFLKQFRFHQTFKDWECHGRTKKPKWENIQDIVSRNALTAPVYVGDTEGDQVAARIANVAFIHVAYGFGKTEASKTFDSFEDLVSAFV